MSDERQVPIIKSTCKVKCSHCDNQLQFDVYPLIDLQKDQDLYNDLFSLDLFKQVCPKCSQMNVIQYNTLIIDRYKKYMVYLYNIADMGTFREDIDQYMQTLQSSDSTAIKETLNNLRHTRVVNSLNDMLQKLLIYDYDLNDKIIELIKRGLYENKLLDQNEYDCVAFNKIERDKLVFTCFSLTKPAEISAKDVSVDIQYYNTLIDALGQAVNEFKQTDFPLINKQWAKNIINLTRNN